LIITGSRKFTDRVLVREVVGRAYEVYGPGLVLVHGCAPGADRLADEAARALGLTCDPRRADWAGPCRPTCKAGHRRRRGDGSTYCPAAGVYRNQLMADLGADECAAFLVEPSISPCDGTRDMILRAERAKIPVSTYPRGLA
jgi:hypothetical protein